jgi:hypothetical protein
MSVRVLSVSGTFEGFNVTMEVASEVSSPAELKANLILAIEFLRASGVAPKGAGVTSPASSPPLPQGHQNNPGRRPATSPPPPDTTPEVELPIGYQTCKFHHETELRASKYPHKQGAAFYCPEKLDSGKYCPYKAVLTPLGEVLEIL